MTITEQIQQQINTLSLEKQREVLDFAMFLQTRPTPVSTPLPRTLRQHPAFGIWRTHPKDALAYEQALRAEWDERA